MPLDKTVRDLRIGQTRVRPKAFRGVASECAIFLNVQEFTCPELIGIEDVLMILGQ